MCIVSEWVRERERERELLAYSCRHWMCNSNHGHSHSWDCWKRKYLGWSSEQVTPVAGSTVRNEPKQRKHRTSNYFAK